ncbi:MAG: hypothetical protein NTW56_15825 [Alphaproteobacteria bacterium]|nr:hypothetical protein [Alphaproteobacteria bacterium]
MIQTELSADTRAVADMLAACPIDGTISLQAISDRIGRDVRRYRHVLAAAMRVASRERGALFVTIRGHGYQRLPTDRAAEVLGPAARKHIRGTARRTRRKLEHSMARANDMAPDARLRATREIGVLGVLEHITRDATAAKAAASDKPEPVAVVAKSLLAAMTGAA